MFNGLLFQVLLDPDLAIEGDRMRDAQARVREVLPEPDTPWVDAARGDVFRRVGDARYPAGDCVAAPRRGFTVAEDMAAAFAEIAAALHEEPGVDETVEAVLRFALYAVNCTHAGVMLVSERGRRVETTATDPIVEKADQLQLEYQEGPCLSAIVEHDSFVVRDTATDRRWPRWAPRVAELGLRSALGIRLRTTSTAIGSLNLFHTEPEVFDSGDEAVAQILARHASVALANARQDATLIQAIDARNLIGQAQGLLMERFDLDPDQAFAVLRRYSQDHNVKLREVAKRLVDTRRLPD